MRLKLKEEPREWKKFVAVWVVAFLILSVVLWWRGIMGRTALIAMSAALVAVLGLSLIWPRLFRLPYRLVMTATFHVGQVVGKILLSLFFWLAVTPIGLLLRLTGKDPLKLKQNPNATSHWEKARLASSLDRMF